MCDTDDIDYERLKADLADEYGTAVFSGFPAALIDLAELENASEQDLIRKGKKIGLNLQQYIV